MQPQRGLHEWKQAVGTKRGEFNTDRADFR
jgi:hypothetical protein